MTKYVLSFLIALIVENGYGQLDRFRELYFNAGQNQQTELFYQESAKLNESLPLERAYRGVALAMYAGVVGNVADKFSYFIQGKKLIESAVASDWYNPEIRFLRFSVQAEVPFILDYDDQLSEDAYLIIDALEKKYIDPNSYFWTKAIQFMNKSGELNKDQETRLQKSVSWK